jgi:hypothetical protein
MKVSFELELRTIRIHITDNCVVACLKAAKCRLTPRRIDGLADTVSLIASEHLQYNLAEKSAGIFWPGNSVTDSATGTPMEKNVRFLSINS